MRPVVLEDFALQSKAFHVINWYFSFSRQLWRFTKSEQKSSRSERLLSFSSEISSILLPLVSYSNKFGIIWIYSSSTHRFKRQFAEIKLCHATFWWLHDPTSNIPRTFL